MKDKWKFKKVSMRKRQGDVWIVRHKSGTRGYFKTIEGKKPYYVGTMIANELITAELARRLGFPVAQMEATVVKGPDGRPKKGLVSIEHTDREVVTWRRVDRGVKQNPAKFLKNIDLLKRLVAFDAWIVNIDRAMGENLILHRNSKKKKYNWYLIDHANALFGSPYKWKRMTWNSDFWERLWQFYYVPRGLLRLQSSRDSLGKMIRRIERLSERDITKAIASVPRGSLTKQQSAKIKILLLHRRKKLRSIIDRWLAYRGRKEY